jgi:hypothetical protein
MAAGDLIVADDQYEVNAFLMGAAPVLMGETAVEGWDTITVKGSEVDLDLGDGSVAGSDYRGSLTITLPIVILEDTEAEARDTLELAKAAWSPQGGVDVELHRQVAGIHEKVTGRVKGITPVMQYVTAGVIPALCTFRANDPTITVVSS